MRILLLVCVLLASVCCARADDLADAKAAFATLQEYQKTDDARTPELFASDLAVTLLLTDGTEVKSKYLPRADFFRMLRAEMALKQGNQDVYEDVKFVQEGASVRMSCTLLEHKSGLRGPCLILYTRDPQGVFKIRELKVTIHVPARGDAAKSI